MNELFTGVGGAHHRPVNLNQYSGHVHTMDGSRGPSQWLSDSFLEESILSDESCAGLHLIRISGSSMAPTLRDGAIVAVDSSITRFSSGQILVVWIPFEGPVIKRAFIDLEKLTLKADNQGFPDIVIPISELPETNFILGRVKWILQNL